jgi:hypothetical protein
MTRPPRRRATFDQYKITNDPQAPSGHKTIKNRLMTRGFAERHLANKKYKICR